MYRSHSDALKHLLTILNRFYPLVCIHTSLFHVLDELRLATKNSSLCRLIGFVLTARPLWELYSIVRNALRSVVNFFLTGRCGVKPKWHNISHHAIAATPVYRIWLDCPNIGIPCLCVTSTGHSARERATATQNGSSSCRSPSIQRDDFFVALHWWILGCLRCVYPSSGLVLVLTATIRILHTVLVHRDFLSSERPQPKFVLLYDLDHECRWSHWACPDWICRRCSEYAACPFRVLVLMAS